MKKWEGCKPKAARLEAELARLKWQPIETAPKTTPEEEGVFLYSEEYGYLVHSRREEGKWVEQWSRAILPDQNPTHWMPLPELPEEKQIDKDKE